MILYAMFSSTGLSEGYKMHKNKQTIAVASITNKHSQEILWRAQGNNANLRGEISRSSQSYRDGPGKTATIRCWNCNKHDGKKTN